MSSNELNYFKEVQHRMERFFQGSFSFLSTSCNAVGSLDLGFKTKPSTQPSLQYIIDNDDSTILSKSVDTNSIWSKILLQVVIPSKSIKVIMEIYVLILKQITYCQVLLRRRTFTFCEYRRSQLKNRKSL